MSAANLAQGSGSAVNALDALFLRGLGRGSALERLWYRDSLPVHWWDQPRVGSLNALADAAAAELERMASDGPVHVIGHSFGAQAARVLADSFPERISRLTLLGCPFDPVEGAIRLGETIARTSRNAALEDSIRRAREMRNLVALREMILAAAADPSFPAIYFGPNSFEVREWFLRVQQSVPVDFEMFLALMDESLRNPPKAAESRYRGEVRLILGTHDPVLSLEGDTRNWCSVFPAASSERVDTGHYVHLEAGPECWLFWPADPLVNSESATRRSR
ncbi:putative uncharacterized protein [Burkholderiales bacterium GJ-E10]|nr:putative uncharacterized protein [Burkholderiales bacterium GJ-E10]